MATAADITRRIFQAYNDRDLDGMLASVNPDVRITLPGGQLISGREEMRAHEQQEWEGFPDARVEVRQVIDQGSMAVAEYIWAATNTGPLNLPDGSTLPADVSLSFLRFRQAEYLVVYLTDVTERRRALAALQESEARLQGIAANVPGLVFRLERAQLDAPVDFAFISEG